jgi:hypothetical protein
MKHLHASIVFAILVSGCAQPKSNTKPAASGGARPGVIRLGMNFEKARGILMEHGAKETMFQMQLAADEAHPENDLHFYYLPSGPTMEVLSEAAEAGRTIYSISVSTYEPKSWTSKIDPEREKFFDSFRQVEEYDLDNPPNLSNEPTSVSAAP